MTPGRWVKQHRRWPIRLFAGVDFVPVVVEPGRTLPAPVELGAGDRLHVERGDGVTHGVDERDYRPLSPV